MSISNKLIYNDLKGLKSLNEELLENLELLEKTTS
jgi:hypothetical protein